MKEKLVRKIFFFSGYDLRAVEEYLEEMALSGFMFVKQKGLFFYFRKCEPKKVRFYVDVFPKASVFDAKPGKKTFEFIPYCKDCGWEFLFSDGQRQFFVTEDPEAIPIHTDAGIRLKTLCRNTFITNGMVWLGLLYLFIIFGIMTFVIDGTLDSVLSMGNFVLLFLCLFIIHIFDMGRFLGFYLRNKKRVKEGQDLVFYSKKNVVCYHMIRNVTVWAMIVCFFAILILSGTIFSRIMLTGMILYLLVTVGIELFRRKIGCHHHIILTIIVALLAVNAAFGVGIAVVSRWDFHKDNQEIPVTIEDLGISPEAEEYREMDKDIIWSFIGNFGSYEQTVYSKNMMTEAYLDYEVLKSPFSFMITFYEDKLFERDYSGKKRNNKELASWCNAKEAYYIASSEEYQMMIVYSDCLIWVTGSCIPYEKEIIQNMLPKLTDVP